MKIGVAGLGLMGSGIAKRLINSGFELSVYNRSSAKAEKFAGIATIVKSPFELANNCDLVITIVTDFEALQEILIGENGIIKSGSHDLIVADASTISPAQSNSNAVALGKKGIE